MEDFAEGDGEALYELGVEDDGEAHGLDDSAFTESIETLRAWRAPSIAIARWRTREERATGNGAQRA